MKPGNFADLAEILAAFIRGDPSVVICRMVPLVVCAL
jgi:hypothetical protein